MSRQSNYRKYKHQYSAVYFAIKIPTFFSLWPQDKFQVSIFSDCIFAHSAKMLWMRHALDSREIINWTADESQFSFFDILLSVFWCGRLNKGRNLYICSMYNISISPHLTLDDMPGECWYANFSLWAYSACILWG